MSVNNRAARGFSFSPHAKFADGNVVGGMEPRIVPALALPIG